MEIRLSSAATSAADAGLSSGDLASRRMISASKTLGTPELWYEGAVGGVLMCWEMTATESWPVNGG